MDEQDWTQPLIASHLTDFETSTAQTLCRILKCVCENLDPLCFTPDDVEENFNELGGKCRHGKNKVPNRFEQAHLEYLETVKLIARHPGSDTFEVADTVRQLYEPAPVVISLTDDDVVDDDPDEPTAWPDLEITPKDSNGIQRIPVYTAT